MTRRAVVLVPAHNREACIAGTLRSLQAQTRRSDRAIVITDDCSDGTAGIAEEHGVEVFVTVGKRHKKAGALNQVLDHVRVDDAGRGGARSTGFPPSRIAT